MSKTLKKKTKSPPQKAKAVEDTAQRILKVATQLFAEKGFDGVSTKAICDQAQVNIAAIHYHFGTKELLYQKILNQFVNQSLDTATRTLRPPQNLEELRVRLEISIRETIESIIKQPEIHLIIHREVEMFHEYCEGVFKDTIQRLIETLGTFFAAAKEKGLLSKDIDPFMAAFSLHSQLAHQMRFDHVLKKLYGHSITEEEYRNRWIHHTLTLFLDGITPRSN